MRSKEASTRPQNNRRMKCQKTRVPDNFCGASHKKQVQQHEPAFTRPSERLFECGRQWSTGGPFDDHGKSISAEAWRTWFFTGVTAP